MAQHIYYGNWIWNGEYWAPPVNNLPSACFDLRGRAACESPGLSTGKGFFVYPQLVSSPLMTYLGERNAPLGTVRKGIIQTELSLGEKIVADTVGGMVAELLLQHAETTWRDRWGRIRGRDWRLACNGEIWKRVIWKDTDPEWLLVLEALRASYQQVKAEVAAGGLLHAVHLRYPTAQMGQHPLPHY